MITPEQVYATLKLITYKPNWFILFHEADFSIQIEATTLDSQTGNMVMWRGGKHRLSKFMCSQELVGIVFHAYKQAELHEVHEFFRYRGAAIYNPHLSPDVLANVASKAKSFVIRDNAMSMKED